ncbi:MAG: pyruvate formate lyase-activating protein [Clostridia bacterium]|nr:pyruvate formate lyase-activating protein [Clostridia bacterium]
MKGRIHSFQSLGTLDGPGVRFVAFFQGCNLRCKCCHNPDTWDMTEGNEYSASEVIEKALRFREYFGNKGGMTLSGGEPLMQSDFACEIFRLAKENNINTCLDTSGSILNDSVKKLLKLTDIVLLDYKYTSDEQYIENVGCERQKVDAFLSYLNEQKIPTVIRQVIIPTLNDNAENIKRLIELKRTNSCIEKIELLPFRKICESKYGNMGIPFPFAHIDTPSKEKMEELNGMIKEP